MSRISCDVTKDLLSVYLDEVCSEESRKLVEEHLKECPSCRSFVEKLKEPDYGKEASKVDGFKKLRRSMDMRTLLGFVIPVLLLLLGESTIRFNGMTVLYYVEMPVLMLVYAFLLTDGGEETAPARTKWSVFSLSLLTAVFAVLMRYLAVRWIVTGASLPVPVYRLGPFICGIMICIAIAEAVLLTALLFIAKKKKQVFYVSQNLAWLGMNLALSFCSFLNTMSEQELMVTAITRDTLILTVEFAAVTILLYVIRYVRGADV